MFKNYHGTVLSRAVRRPGARGGDCARRGQLLLSAAEQAVLADEQAVVARPEVRTDHDRLLGGGVGRQKRRESTSSTPRIAS